MDMDTQRTRNTSYMYVWTESHFHYFLAHVVLSRPGRCFVPFEFADRILDVRVLPFGRWIPR